MNHSFLEVLSPGRNHPRKQWLFSVVYRAVSSEAALQPLHDPGPKMVLAHLERPALLGTANSAQEGLKWLGCNVFLRKTYRLDQGLWYGELVLPRKQLRCNNQTTNQMPLHSYLGFHSTEPEFHLGVSLFLWSSPAIQNTTEKMRDEKKRGKKTEREGQRDGGVWDQRCRRQW